MLSGNALAPLALAVGPPTCCLVSITPADQALVGGSPLAFAARDFPGSRLVLDCSSDSLTCLEHSISPFRQVTALAHLNLVHLCCKGAEHGRCSHAAAP